MSPKMTDYPKNRKSKIKPKTAMGGGVGFVTGEEQKGYDLQKNVVFSLINLTPLASRVQVDENVFPFYNDDTLFIHTGEGCIGEAPTETAKTVIKIMKQGFRPDGLISAITEHGQKRRIEITLIMRTDNT